uniref:Uncharacterized protein n=1 Tax=Parascaris equorum TaxID=6256 RepID=A0A914RA38_PAREQ
MLVFIVYSAVEEKLFKVMDFTGLGYVRDFADEPDSVTHQHEMPKVAPPEELRDFREIIEDSLRDEMVTTAMKAMLKYKLNEMPPAFARIFEVLFGKHLLEGYLFLNINTTLKKYEELF